MRKYSDDLIDELHEISPDIIIHGKFALEISIIIRINMIIDAGVPEMATIEPPNAYEHTLLILDDLMKETCENGTLTELMTKASHHCKISVIVVDQVENINVMQIQ